MQPIRPFNTFQEAIATELRARGVGFKFFETSYEYNKPVRAATYIPPFVLDNGLVIQSKGRFVTADRQKHILIRQQHPELDIRFVFYDSRQRLSSKSETTYAMWAGRYGFRYSCRNESKKAKLPLVPLEWTA